jgi:hypothetical protein
LSKGNRFSTATHVFQDGVVDRFHDTVDGKTQGFTGNGSPVGAATADAVIAFHDCNAFTVLSGLHSGSLTAGASSNNDHIVFISKHTVVVSMSEVSAEGPCNRNVSGVGLVRSFDQSSVRFGQKFPSSKYFPISTKMIDLIPVGKLRRSSEIKIFLNVKRGQA